MNRSLTNVSDRGDRYPITCNATHIAVYPHKQRETGGNDAMGNEKLAGPSSGGCQGFARINPARVTIRVGIWRPHPSLLETRTSDADAKFEPHAPCGYAWVNSNDNRTLCFFGLGTVGEVVFERHRRRLDSVRCTCHFK